MKFPSRFRLTLDLAKLAVPVHVDGEQLEVLQRHLDHMGPVAVVDAVLPKSVGVESLVRFIEGIPVGEDLLVEELLRELQHHLRSLLRRSLGSRGLRLRHHLLSTGHCGNLKSDRRWTRSRAPRYQISQWP